MTTKLIALLLATWSSWALADTPPARVINSLTYDAASNAITSTVSGAKRGLDCNVSNAVAAPGNFQTIVSGAAIDPRSIRALTTSDQVSCSQLGTWNIGSITGSQTLPTNAAQETGGNLATVATQATAINGKMTSFDLDTGAGVQNVQGVGLRLSASGGSVEAGTSANPLRFDPTGTTTQPVSAASLPLPSGASTSALQTTGNSSLSSIDGKLNNTSGGALKVDGSTFTQPVSAASLPLPAGAATASNQTTSNTSLSNINSKLFINGSSDATKVDGSSFTQPVSGTVTSNQGGSWSVAATQSGAWTVAATQSGTWNINTVTTLPLPSGAATSANQSSEITAINNISAKLGTLGQKSSSGSAPVVLASDQPAVPVTLTSTSANQGTPASVGNAWPILNTDGTNTAAVKAANSAPASTDPALVVAISPNSPIVASPPANTMASGNLTVACATGISCGANSTLQLSTNGTTTFGYETHGTWSATLTTDVSFDSTCSSAPASALWYQTASVDTATNESTYVNVWGSTRNNAPWVMNVSGAFCARVRVVSYTSGTIVVTATTGVGVAMVWDVPMGNVSSGSTDLGAPIKVGGVYRLTPPTFTDGQRADLQLNANGALVTRPLTAAVDTVNVNNIAGTVSLPTGAATSAAQTTGNASLASIDTKTPALVTGRVPVDGSGVTQPVSGTVTANAGSGTFAISAAALPLPAGASTAAKQPALGTAGTASADVLSVQGVASMTPLLVNGSGVTQPVSGTVTANAGTGTFAVSAAALPLPSGAATSALQTSGNSSLSSIDTKTPALGQALAAASVPVVLTAAQLSTLTPLTTVATTQSGTWTVQPGNTANTTPWLATINQGGNSATVSGAGALKVDGSAVTQPISAVSLPLPTGAATAAKQPALGTAGTPSADVLTVQGSASMTALKVDGSAVTQPVSGTVTANAGTGTFAISAAALPLPSGAATETSLAKLTLAQGSTTSGQSGSLMLGAVTTAAPSYTTAQSNSLSLTTAGALRVDNSSNTQPISASALPLPTGASTSALQTTGNSSLSSIDTKTPALVSGRVPVDISGVSVAAGTNTIGNVQITDGTNNANISTAGAVHVVRDDGYKTTYSVGVAGLAVVTGATDVFTLTGSASKLVRVTRLSITGSATAAVSVNTSIIKRSTADTGGTSTTPAIVPLDSTNGAATAVVNAYTANPTSLGTSVGIVRAAKVVFPTAGTPISIFEFPFGDTTGQALVLRGTTQQLAVNLNATAITAGNADIYVEWTEE